MYISNDVNTLFMTDDNPFLYVILFIYLHIHVTQEKMQFTLLILPNALFTILTLSNALFTILTLSNALFILLTL